MNDLDSITIAYFTCRKNCKIEWFIWSLNRELNNNWSNVNIIMIDYWLQYEGDKRVEEIKNIYKKYTSNFKHVSPLPSAIQGIHKLTKQDHFAASNSRNTAFFYCDTSYIVCIDDLTVLKPGWFDVVLFGKKNNYCVYGSYAKVNELICNENGEFTYKEDSFLRGLDSRFNNEIIDNDFATKVAGSWLFGCSFCLPLELALKIDGFDTACDGQCGEDYDFGIRLGRITSDIYYSRQMFTFENDELHHSEGNVKFFSSIKKLTEETTLKNKIGVDSDHAILQDLLESNRSQPLIKNNLIELRSKNLLPIPNYDSKDWRDGELIRNL